MKRNLKKTLRKLDFTNSQYKDRGNNMNNPILFVETHRAHRVDVTKFIVVFNNIDIENIVSVIV